MRKRFLFTWHHHGNINSLYSLFVIHGGGGVMLTILRKYCFLLKQRVRLKLITSFYLKMSTSPAIFIMLTEPVQPGQAFGKIKKIFKSANCMTFFVYVSKSFPGLKAKKNSSNRSVVSLYQTF